MSDLSIAIENLEYWARHLRHQVLPLQSTIVRQRIAFTSIIDLVDGCELNGDSREALRKSVAEVLAAIKAVAENGMQKGMTQ